MRFTRLFGLTVTLAAVAPLGDAMAFPGDGAVVYTFDDLRVNCGWNVTTSGLYADLVFPPSVYMAPCNAPNGTVGLVPSREGVAGRLEVRVRLSGPASAVSVDSYLYSVGEDPTLIAYDVDGVEIGRVSDGTLNSWVTLEVVAGDKPIQEIGLLMPQLRSYLDNITMTPAATDPVVVPDPTDPDPPVEDPIEDPKDPVPPVVEPTDTEPVNPRVRSDCMSRGWGHWGFRNQGQCMRFLQTGKDSREAERHDRWRSGRDDRGGHGGR